MFLALGQVKLHYCVCSLLGTGTSLQLSTSMSDCANLWWPLADHKFFICDVEHARSNIHKFLCYVWIYKESWSEYTFHRKRELNILLAMQEVVVIFYWAWRHGGKKCIYQRCYCLYTFALHDLHEIARSFMKFHFCGQTLAKFCRNLPIPRRCRPEGIIQN